MEVETIKTTDWLHMALWTQTKVCDHRLELWPICLIGPTRAWCSHYTI